jgi:hypothetical protein
MRNLSFFVAALLAGSGIAMGATSNPVIQNYGQPIDMVHQEIQPQKIESNNDHENSFIYQEGQSTLVKAGDSDIDVLAYVLKLNIDPDRATIVGTEDLAVKALAERLDVIELDAVDMTIARVQWQDGSDVLFKYDFKKLSIIPPMPMTAGQAVKLTIHYATERPQFLHQALPDGTRPNRVTSLYTYTEPFGSRHWFPCHDVPSDKAKTTIRVTVPKQYQVVSNGQEFGEIYDGQAASHNQTTWAFDGLVPIATYLTSLVVAPMQSITIGQHNGTIPLQISGPSYLMPAIKKDTERTEHMIQSFEHFTQTRYPFNKYRQTVAEGYGSSMEHQSATTMGGRVFSGDRALESVVAHELAHQWFGDLATCGIWGELWLNEGFATYLPFVFFNDVRDYDAFALTYIKNREWYFASTNHENARALSTPDVAPTFNIFDQHAYAKGAMVIHWMRQLANTYPSPVPGVETFSVALREYFKANAYGNVTHMSLMNALESVTNTDWKDFFDQWVLSIGHPEITSSWRMEGSRFILSVKQDQTSAAKKPWRVFSFPLEAILVTKSGRTIKKMINVSNAQEDFAWDMNSEIVKAVVLDPEQKIPGSIAVDQSVEGWHRALLKSDNILVNAQELQSMFRSTNVDGIKTAVSELINVAKTPLANALIARQIVFKNDARLLDEGRKLLSLYEHKSLPLGLRATFASLKAWIIIQSKPEERPSFAALAKEFLDSKRVDERETLAPALLAVDLHASQKLAMEQLARGVWTDRDQLHFVGMVAKEVNEDTRAFILDLLKRNYNQYAGRGFLQQLIANNIGDSSIYPVLKEGALGHRATNIRKLFIDLLGLQKDQKDQACRDLDEIKTKTESRGTSYDRDTLPDAINAAKLRLACP